MKINDFKPGQTVYALMVRKGRTTEHFIMRRTVHSVGRKYVHTNKENGGYHEQFFKQREEDEYLIEKEDWGNSRLKLFLTEQAANDYIEKTMLQAWVMEAVSFRKIETYTLDQLRAARAALEGNLKNEEETENGG